MTTPREPFRVTRYRCDDAGHRACTGCQPDWRAMAEDGADLRRRIDRTLDYTDALLRLPDLASDLTVVLRAVHGSLCSPATDRPVTPGGAS